MCDIFYIKMILKFKNDELNNLVREINNNNKLDNVNICNICKDPLIIDTINLKCNHVYHSSCLKETFIKYQSKKCPLCSELILWESFKSKCITIKKDKTICNRICYNNELICNLHTNCQLKKLKK